MTDKVQVLCTRPNASELINGVVFTPTKDGMLSEPLTPEQAGMFTEIPGYSIRSSSIKRGKPEPSE